MNDRLVSRKILYVSLVGFIVLNLTVITFLEVTSKGLWERISENPSKQQNKQSSSGQEGLVNEQVEMVDPFPKITTNTAIPVPPKIGTARGVIVRHDSKNIILKNLEGGEQSLGLLKETTYFRKSSENTLSDNQPIKLEDLRANDKVTIVTAERAGKVYATMVNKE